MAEMLEYNDPHAPHNHPKRKLERFLTHLGKRKALNLAVLTFAALMMPVALLAVQQQTSFKQQAASSTQVVFVDQNNAPITETTVPTVKVKLTSPYAVAMAQKTVAGAADYNSVLAAANATFQVTSSIDDLNEVNGKLDPNVPSNAREMWIGTGGSSTSYTGFRFTNIQLPKGAKINSARLAMQATKDQWMQIGFQIAGENSGNSVAFSAISRPSQRSLTAKKVTHSSNVKWSANNWYTLDEMNAVIQEIVNRPDWKAGNSISIILKGSGSGYGRKFVKSFDAGATTAPKLLISYETTTQPTITNTPSPTLRPTNTPVPPTATRVPTATPTRVPTATTVPATATSVPTATSIPAPVTTSSIMLSEDPNFLTNVQTISPVRENPTYFTYTFSNSTAGEKLLFAKFKASNGQEQVFSSSIMLTQIAQNPSPTHAHGTGGESMAMMAWRVGGKNSPNPAYDKCEDGTDVVAAHNAYYVIAYDGVKYPTWHPAVVTNPITGNGKCFFGHEHGTNPSKYMYFDEIAQHFGKDMNGDGSITKMTVADDGKITEGDRAGIPFGIANEHMDKYYNQEGRDSLFVRHEDHVGHKIELVNSESEMVGNTTHPMAQLAGTNGTNVPYYQTGSETFQPTGVSCTHLHKFHQGSASADAVRNNLHEVIFHSRCQSVNVNNINAQTLYPDNTVLLTGMMAFGKPGEYQRFCFAQRTARVCADGQNADGSCTINDPLISKLPSGINSTSLGRNMVDKTCLDNWSSINPGNNYFGPYELWEGDLRIQTASGDMLAEHGRQWDILDPIRFVDVGYQHPTRTWQKDFQFNSENCKKPGGAYDQLTFVGGCADRNNNVAWDSPQSGFKGLKRTTYFGRNRVSNPGGPEIVWTDPLGGNAVPSEFPSGLKQKITSVEADIQRVQSKVQQLFGGNHFLNDRAIQRRFNDGGGTVHAPN